MIIKSLQWLVKSWQVEEMASLASRWENDKSGEEKGRKLRGERVENTEATGKNESSIGRNKGTGIEVIFGLKEKLKKLDFPASIASNVYLLLIVLTKQVFIWKSVKINFNLILSKAKEALVSLASQYLKCLCLGYVRPTYKLIIISF